MAKKIEIKMNVGSFIHKKTELKGRNGMVRGVFIPFEVNHIFEGRNGKLYADFVAWKNKTPNDWSTHGIKQAFSQTVNETMTKDERYALPFFGNLTALEDTPVPTTAENTDVTENKDVSISIDDEEDDLPF